jgi:hypothetical protein
MFYKQTGATHAHVTSALLTLTSSGRGFARKSKLQAAAHQLHRNLRTGNSGRQLHQVRAIAGGNYIKYGQ